MNNKKHNIIVSGASGFIGKSLIMKLIEDGHHVFGLVRTPIRHFNSVFYTNILIEDISSNIDFDADVNVDIIYHLAAKTHSVSNNYKEYYDVNVLGLQSIINLSNRLSVKKIIMLSSIKVNGEGFKSNHIFYSEKSVEKPQDNYGLSKLEAENILKSHCINADVGFVILRPPLVYGTGVKGNLKKLMSYIDRNIPLPIINTKNKRSLISLRNLVNALIIIMHNENIKNKTYLVADDIPISVEDLYKNIAKIMNKKLFIIKFYSLFFKILLWPIGKSILVEKISNSLIVDNTKIKKETDWDPKTNIMDELKYMIEKKED